MKHFLPLLLLTGLAWGQFQNPVTITAKVDESARAGEIIHVKLIANMDDEWRIYALKDAGDGPIPTKISIRGDALTQQGKIIEPTPIEKFDEGFNTVTRYHAGTTTFSIPVQLDGNLEPGQIEVTATVMFQVWNGVLIYPPKEVTVDVPIIIEKDEPKTVISKTISKFNVEEKFGEYVYASFPFQVIKVNYNNDGLVKDSAYYDFHGELVNLGDIRAFYLGWDNYREKVAKYKFEYNENSQIIDKSHYNARGSLVFKKKYNYDLNGIKNEVTDFDGEGKLSRKYLWKYDTNGLKIEEIEYKSDGSLDEKVKYEYNSDKKMEKKTIYYSDGEVKSLKYEYTSFGKTSKVESYVADDWDRDSLVSHDLHTYDSLENLVSIVTYKKVGWDSRLVDYQFLWKYDDYGKKIEHSYENLTHIYKSTSLYTYNEDLTLREALEGKREMKFGELKFVPSELTTYNYSYTGDSPITNSFDISSIDSLIANIAKYAEDLVETNDSLENNSIKIDEVISYGDKPQQSEDKKPKAISVRRLVVCENIDLKNRKPIGIKDVFIDTTSKIYCFVGLRNPKKSENITHVWKFNGEPYANVHMNISVSNYFRCWSYINPRDDAVGQWSIAVLDDESNVLKETSFTIVPFNKQ